MVNNNRIDYIFQLSIIQDFLVNIMSKQGKEETKLLVLRNPSTGVDDKFALSLQPLGGGKFAKVYKAVHLENPNKVFAVKIIAIDSEKVKNEYLKELKVIQHLPASPNIVQIHKQHLESDNNLYIFEEYCEGGTLLDYRLAKKGQPYTENQCYDIFFQTCNGLISLLEAGIVHEDIKPTNIVRKGRRFKHCDFGVSQIVKQFKQDNLRGGTISYMPPQKLKQKFVPNEKSDIYSLGVCLYENIFMFHPYIKHRTQDYREYLKVLSNTELRPINQLLQKYSFPSVQFSFFIRFLQKMICLNVENRVSLSELKHFLANTEPYRSMTIPNEQVTPLQKIRPSFAQNFDILEQSCIVVKEQNSSLNFATSYSLPQAMGEQFQLSRQNSLEGIFDQERKHIYASTKMLFRGVQYLRRSNYLKIVENRMRSIPQLQTELTSFSQIRVIKLLTLHYISTTMQALREKYLQRMQADEEELLISDVQHWNNEMLKYLMDVNSQAQKPLMAELRNPGVDDSIGKILSEHFAQMFADSQMIKLKREGLLGFIFLKHSKQILESIEQLIEETEPINSKEYLVSAKLRHAKDVLHRFEDYQLMDEYNLMREIEDTIGKEQDLVFELISDSDEYELMEQIVSEM